jgi:hypothetical protein
VFQSVVTIDEVSPHADVEEDEGNAGVGTRDLPRIDGRCPTARSPPAPVGVKPRAEAVEREVFDRNGHSAQVPFYERDVEYEHPFEIPLPMGSSPIDLGRSREPPWDLNP